jgi:hypothetical protein
VPQFLEPDRFSLRVVGGAPQITLDGVTISATEGWSLLNRATLIVVDGPGDQGFLLPRHTAPDRDHAPEGWDAAVAAKGSVEVHVPGAQVSAKVIE